MTHSYIENRDQQVLYIFQKHWDKGEIRWGTLNKILIICVYHCGSWVKSFVNSSSNLLFSTQRAAAAFWFTERRNTVDVQTWLMNVGAKSLNYIEASELWWCYNCSMVKLQNPTKQVQVKITRFEFLSS